MSCRSRAPEDLEEVIAAYLEQIDKIVFADLGTHVDGIECLFGARVAQVLRDDCRRVADLANEARMNFDAYRNGVAQAVVAAGDTMERRVGELVARLERATTCAACTQPLTTSVVHRARIGDVEHRWHPKCCAGRCGNSDEHTPSYLDADVPARQVDVALELQTGVH